jgi:protein SCO1/2
MRRLLAFSFLALISLTGCHPGQKAPLQQASIQSFRVYHLRGKVVSTDASKGEVTVDQEAIPGFMEAMTMPYKLKDAHLLGQIHSGDVITADLLVPPDPAADDLLDHIVVVTQAKPQ